MKSNKKKSRKDSVYFNSAGYRKRRTQVYMKVGLILLCILLVGLFVFQLTRKEKPERDLSSHLNVDASQPEIDVQLLDINEYSRPALASDPITGIVIHYTANPGSTAQENRDFFDSLKDGHGESVSSHFVVGLEGEIVQCVPTWELAYASNERNHDTVSIECCHPDETGKFTKETYQSMVQLTAFLCDKFDLTENDVIRHYDVTGKNCPKYFVEEEEAWQIFRTDVREALAKTHQKESAVSTMEENSGTDVENKGE